MSSCNYSAAPADIAKLRHLYANLKNGGVRGTAQAKRIADGLLAPIIERLELYQAAPKAAPATQQPEGDVVAYLDVGANGYLDLGSELSEAALQQLPKGRHALVIAGAYGIDGYVAAPQPAPAPLSEREAFEAWIEKDGGDLGTFGTPPNMHYRNSAVNNAWVAWKARAAIAAQGGK